MSLQTKLEETMRITLPHARDTLTAFSSKSFKDCVKEFVDFCSDSVKNYPSWKVTVLEHTAENPLISCSIAYSYGYRTIMYQASIEVLISKNQLEIQYYGKPPLPRIKGVYQADSDTKLEEVEREPNPLKQAADMLSYMLSL